MKTVLKAMLSMTIGIGLSLSADTLSEGKNALEHHEYILAIEKFSQSCDSNNAQGCIELGKMKEEGIGTAQNKYAAATLYTRACTLGNPLGCANMGLSYDTP